METKAESISERLDIINQKIKQCLSKDKEKNESEICIVAASKTKPKDMIIEAYQNGVRHFGENYVHEIVEKSNDPEVLEMCPDIKWHYIGHLQSNKVPKLLSCPKLYMLHCIDSIKLADLVNKAWIKISSTEHLKVMIQVNTSNESSKSGVREEEVDTLAKHIVENCPNVSLSGFMTIGSPNHDIELGPNPEYQMLVTIRDNVSTNYNLKGLQLSMGMSKDFLHAIQLGSSYVRIGESIFGPREKFVMKREEERMVTLPSADRAD